MRRPLRMIVAAVISGFMLAISVSNPVLASPHGLSKSSWRGHWPPLRESAAVTFEDETVIHADKSEVWEILTDFEHYEDWNPWVIEARGQAVPGATIAVKAHMGGMVLPFKQRVLTVKHEKELCWEDSGWNSWFVSAHRCRTLHTLPGGEVLLRQEVAIDGGFIEVADWLMGENLRDGVAAESMAIKRVAER